MKTREEYEKIIKNCELEIKSAQEQIKYLDECAAHNFEQYEDKYYKIQDDFDGTSYVYINKVDSYNDGVIRFNGKLVSKSFTMLSSSVKLYSGMMTKNVGSMTEINEEEWNYQKNNCLSGWIHQR